MKESIISVLKWSSSILLLLFSIILFFKGYIYSALSFILIGLLLFPALSIFWSTIPFLNNTIKSIIILGLFLIAYTSIPSPDKVKENLTYQEYKYVTAKTLNIREKAGKAYNLLGQLHEGDTVELISEENGWSEIKTQSGINGYVATKFISSVDSKEDKPNFFGKILRFIGKLIGAFIVSWIGIAILTSDATKDDSRYNKGYRVVRKGIELGGFHEILSFSIALLYAIFS